MRTTRAGWVGAATTDWFVRRVPRADCPALLYAHTLYRPLSCACAHTHARARAHTHTHTHRHSHASQAQNRSPAARRHHEDCEQPRVAMPRTGGAHATAAAGHVLRACAGAGAANTAAVAHGVGEARPHIGTIAGSTRRPPPVVVARIRRRAHSHGVSSAGRCSARVVRWRAHLRAPHNCR